MRTQKVDEALNKVYELIGKRKVELGEASVHTYDDGAFVHFFQTWDEYFGGSLKKDIKKMGEYPINKKPIMVFAKKGIHIPLYDFDAKKTYVVIRGHIDYFFEDDSLIEMTDFTTMVVPKGKKHGGIVRKDTFVLIMEEELED